MPDEDFLFLTELLGLRSARPSAATLTITIAVRF
jgi:hypothetical protein